ncbi:MAG TPA: hypothetical protein VHN11_18325 [Xanthobacteraceae bacterium]|nr:hypothetical protein [Xanthobacteraceae bacterium]
MKERPILFSSEMVRALLDGRKTQTRRVVKPQPPAVARDVFTFHHPDPRTHFYGFDGEALMDWAQPCPYGEVGDRLYVRETWQNSNHPFGPYEQDCLVFYRADYLDDPLGADLERSPDGIRREWRPSIHMPRAASRITLEVTGVRVERLQDISEPDAIAEGIYSIGQHDCPVFGSHPLWWHEPTDQRSCSMESARTAYATLWDSLNAPHGYGWDTNPWVWVVEFKRIGA